MNALDSQLEALAFNYLSFGFSRIVNHIWAWVAVVSAAVNFCRLNAVKIVCGASKSVNGDTEVSDADQPIVVPTTAPKSVLAAVVETTTGGTTRGEKFTKAVIDQPITVPTTATRAVVAVAETIEGTTRGGKFRVIVIGVRIRIRVLVMRMGAMGWYRNQDLTVLNGNVVRLWDGCRKN
ncbi:hypothetical protein Acr_01g0003080 [Actinidia rufa]|uniref:Uncharacterized protein n=1 Tax=Actinidia rufa TaxID=165716 RepID=A0A7J0E3K4_9ERIC|nr:hypothetical protein Acr_01g0003080 [Actinidia rufa]